MKKHPGNISDFPKKDLTHEPSPYNLIQKHMIGLDSISQKMKYINLT